MKNLYFRRSQVAMLTALLCIGTGSAQAAPLDGGTLDPTSIPKYVTPLVIPPVMKNSGRPDGEYDIAVRQFKQQILPGGVWNTVTGRSDNFPATTIWSYGPAQDPVPDSSPLGGSAGVAPAPNSQFNYPSYTVENTKDVTTKVNWINGLVDENGDALPHLFAVDQSLHWTNPIADCESGELRTDCMGTSAEPYKGPVPMVAHLHGAHVGAAGDGYTEAWWLPDADNIECVPRDESGNLTAVPTGYDANNNTWNVACEGTIANKLTNRRGEVVHNVNNPDPNAPKSAGPGAAHYGYHNDQPSATLWFHDHSLGMTRLNVYAGPAGFYLIRDVNGSETGLRAGSKLPAPAPVAGENLSTTNFPATLGGSRHKYREIPIVIQDRSFNDDGSLFYPDNRAFFEGLNVEGTDADGQFPAGTGELQIDMDPETSDIAPIWNPEAFFNTMVVNGVTWPKLEVAPALYRFRILNGSNSRFLNLSLPVTDEAGNQITVSRKVYRYEDNGRPMKPRQFGYNELRFWQIGTEQSLLPKTVAIRTGFATAGLKHKSSGRFTREKPAPDPAQAMLLGPAERSDVIVDFRGYPDGTIITMSNTAPDAPFGGFPDVPADPSTTGQVMRFVVNHDLLGTSPSDELHPNLGDRVTYVNHRGRTVTRTIDKQKLSVILNRETAASRPWDLKINKAKLNNFKVAVTKPTPRELALIEEESSLICADVDLDGNFVQVAGDPHLGCPGTSAPFGPKAAVLGTVDPAGVSSVTLWSDPITTNVNADGSGSETAEQWNLWNVTADAHPIHVHLVKFKVLGRSAIGGGASIVSTRNGNQEWENGWKDTVISYPGEITSLAADFDINGLYVWHCHILEHEDNEMMVPLCVGEAGVDCPTQLF